MYRFIKRLFDIFISLFFFICFGWLFIFLCVLVRIKLGSPILFKQNRPGKGEKIFTLYKFRSMTNEKDADGNLLPDEKRLTKFGQFLRSTSLDELPEFYNILKGDMSLIGPRPLLIQYLPLYTEDQKKRHNVRPGLTGWSQVNGRNAIDWNQKLFFDVYYVNNLSLSLDLKIFFKTILYVIKRSGISEEGHVTKSYFTGTKENDK